MSSLFRVTPIYCSLKNKMGGARGTYRERSAYTGLVGKPKEKRLLGRPRRRWEDNIKMNQEVGCTGLNWVDWALDGDTWRALVYAVMNLRPP
jgi:hypothetical protein